MLANWLIEVAERSGWLAQSTAVPGVAQRTGATVYYLEVFPFADGGKAAPVLALMPVPGHVDVVIAGELVEAGRAVLRGLVTRERTTLIASTHRDFAIDEKSAMGDGRVDAQRLRALVERSARRFTGFDMAAVAEETESVISSVLLGAIAGTGISPFGKEACAEVIRAMGVAVDANLRAFEAGYSKAGAGSRPEVSEAAAAARPRAQSRQVQGLLETVYAEYPQCCWDIVVAALRRLIDYQDAAYAREYLERLAPILAADRADENYRLTLETARYLALGLTYEDVIRVADLKTRSARFSRVRQEVQSEDGQVVAVEEFMHPRVEEICDVMPAWLGSWCLKTPPLRNFIGLFCREGRRIRTTSLPGFLLLYLLAGLRRFRRGTLRFRTETNQLGDWLSTVQDAAAADYPLAVEIAECRSLVKGYGETHARGRLNYGRVMAVLGRIRTLPEPAAAVRELREAALADADGKGLETAMRRLL